MKRKKVLNLHFKKRMISLIAVLFTLFLCSSLQQNQLVDPQITNAETINDLKVPQPNAIITDNMSLVNWFDDLDTGENWNVQANHSEARRSLQDGIFRIEGYGTAFGYGNISAVYTLDLSSTYPITDALLEIYVRANTVSDVALYAHAGSSVGSVNQLIKYWATISSSWSILSVKLSEGNIAASKPFFINITGSVRNDLDWIEIDWIRLRSFNSSVSFNNSISGADDFVANLTLEDSINMVNRTLTTIRLYYNLTGNQVTSSSPSIAATGTYPNFQSSTWSAVPTTQPFDIHRYQIHRSTSEDFVPHVSNMIAVIDGTEYIDSVEEEGVYYYRIVVVDRAGNLSPASDILKVDTINPTGANLGGIILTSLAIIGGVVGFVVILNKKKNSYTTFKEPKAPKAPKIKGKKGKRTDPFEMLEDKGAKSERANRDPNKPTISGGTGIMGSSAAAVSRNALNAKSSAAAHADDGWGTSSSASDGWGSPGTTAPSSKPELAPIQVPEGAELMDGIPCSFRWSDEMKDLYKDAKDFLDLDNKQSAIESLEILVRKAESRNDEHTRAWAKSEIERIYREH